MNIEILVPVFNDKIQALRILSYLEKNKPKNIKFKISDDSKFLISDTQLVKRLTAVDVLVLEHENTGNPIDNWNYLIEMCDSEYFQLLHQDEFFSDDSDLNCLDNMIPNFSDINLFRIRVCKLGGKNNRDHTCSLLLRLILRERYIKFLLWKNLIGPPSSLVVKNNKIMYNRDYVWLVDVLYYLDLFSHFKYSFKLLPYTLVSYTSDASITSKLNVDKIKRRELRDINYSKNAHDYLILIMYSFCRLFHWARSI